MEAAERRRGHLPHEAHGEEPILATLRLPMVDLRGALNQRVLSAEIQVELASAVGLAPDQVRIVELRTALAGGAEVELVLREHGRRASDIIADLLQLSRSKGSRGGHLNGATDLIIHSARTGELDAWSVICGILDILFLLQFQIGKQRLVMGFDLMLQM